MNCVLVAAIAKNGIIGNQGKLPWTIPEELEWFRKRIKGSCVVVGRKTYQGLLNKGLGAREIGILGKNFDITFCTNNKKLRIFNSVNDVVQRWGNKNFLVIGGEEVYRSFFSIASSLELNFIQKCYAGDTYFPLKQLKSWRIVNFNSKYFENIKINFTVWKKKN